MSWNKNSAKVLGITAAAAMALSLTPAAAFTAAAAPAKAGSSVSAQSVSSTYNFSHGQISGAEYNNTALTPVSNNGTLSYVVESAAAAAAVKPTKITPLVGEAITLTYTNNTTAYGSDGETYTLSYTAATTSDPAKVTVTRSSDSAAVSVNITVTARALTNAVVVNPSTGTSTFVYNGSSVAPNFQQNGHNLVSGTDFASVQYGKEGSNAALTSAPTDAGTYYAVLKDAAGQVIGEPKFTISPLDLSKADVTVKNLSDTATSVDLSNVLVNGEQNSGLSASTAELKIVSDPAGGAVFGAKGKYTASVSAKAGQQNVIGSANVTFYKVTNADPLTVTYNGNPSTTPVTVDLDTPSTAFDLAKLAVSAGSTNLASGKYTVTYKKQGADGNFEASDLQTLNSVAGTYQVTVAASPAATNNEFGGEQTINVTVKHSVKAHDFVTINGKLITNYTGSYNGNAVKPSVVVKAGNKVLVDGTDYTVTYYLNNVKVDEVKNAGNYTVQIDLKNGYKFDTTTAGASATSANRDVINFSISPLAVNGEPNPSSYISTKKLANLTTYKYAFTGKDIVPALVFKDSTDHKIWNVDPTEYQINIKKATLSSGATATSGTFTDGDVVASMKDLGWYHITLVDVANGNYTVAGNFYVEVTNVRNYKDVPNNAWYTPYVNSVTKKDLMHGYAGTKLFGPNNKLTRAEAATILYNWANKRANHSDETIEQNLGNQGYNTPFKDVDSSNSMAKEIQWAAKVGLMTGYKDASGKFTGIFKPNQNITRQEFAVIINRFAQAWQKTDDAYKAADVSALDAYNDSKAVVKYAKEGFAWTVANKVMGVDVKQLKPNADITRAEVAATIDRASDIVK